MDQAAALITSIAALIGAVAWPIAFLAVFLLFRSPIRTAFEKLPSVIDRMRTVKIGLLEAELNEEAAAMVEETAENLGGISAQQIRSAARIEIRAKSLDDQALRDQLQQLCIEYDTIRKVMPAGAERTHAMTQVLIKMRTLGPAVDKFLAELKSSASPGNRLAAIAIMQIEPDKADISWLLERFKGEQPFIFFHAAVALQSVARSGSEDGATKAIQAARTALDIVQAFKGMPDRGTVNILEAIIEGSN